MRGLQKLFIGILLLAGLFVRPADAQQIVLRADAILDVAAGRLVRPAVVVVEGERIVEVNPGRLPEEATQIDLAGLVLAPGLIDVHTHLTFQISGDWINRPVHETSEDAALRGVAHARRTLMAGFTTVRDLGAFSGGPDVALMHAIERGDIVICDRDSLRDFVSDRIDVLKRCGFRVGGLGERGA